MTQENTHIVKGSFPNTFFIHRPDGSEIKVEKSTTDHSCKNTYPIDDYYINSPVVLTDNEIAYIQNTLDLE